MSKRTITISLVLAVLATALPVAAEVAATTDRRGDYVATRVVATGPASQPNLWTVRTVRTVRGVRGVARGGAVLNPDGDVNGDLRPTVAESPVAPFHPWVVWSRSTGYGYDLAYSRWTDRGWAAVQWVHESTTVEDELDADVAFDDVGRPYVAYWTESGGLGEVWVSIFQNSRWSAPFRVSEPGLDARYPQLDVVDSTRLVVDFETPDGVYSQQVLFKRPVSITDDINPQVHISLYGEPEQLQKMPY